MNRLYLLSLLCCLCWSLFSQGKDPQGGGRRIRMMSYNVENLFDTIDQVGRDDDEFTPQGAKRWDTQRFKRKVRQIGEVIALAGAMVPVDLVALQEVETLEAVDYLMRVGGLRSRGYSSISSQGTDSRGIGLTLIYRPRTLVVEGTQEFLVSPPSEGLSQSRPLFHVFGRLPSGDRLHLVLCHLPSRRMGRLSDRYREVMLKQVTNLCQQIIEQEGADALIAVLGDMNSSPAYLSRSGSLISARPTSRVEDDTSLLYNISQDHSLDAPSGSYCYRGTWEMIDQIMLSRGFFLEDSRMQIERGSFRIFAPSPLRSPKDSRHKGAPRRTYLGDYYQGGYSDHFPIYADFLLR